MAKSKKKVKKTEEEEVKEESKEEEIKEEEPAEPIIEINENDIEKIDDDIEKIIVKKKQTIFEEEEIPKVVSSMQTPKDKIIEEIIELGNQKGEKLFPKQLKKKKIEALQQMKENYQKTKVEAMPNPLSQLSVQSGGNCLFQMCILCCSACEVISQMTKDKTGIYFDTLQKDVMQEKENLLPCLQEIYKESPDVIARYAGPRTQFLLIMGGCLAHSLKKNSPKPSDPSLENFPSPPSVVVV